MASVEISTSLPTKPLHYMMKMNKTYQIEFTDFIYPGFYFERPVYLYVWEILVVFTSLVNVITVYILLRKEMRNPANIVLAAIAISDSLTGLSTLPTNRMTYQQYSTNNKFTVLIHGSDEEINSDSECQNASLSKFLIDNQTELTHSVDCPYYDGYVLNQEQCEWFMISKFFISPSFHLISIYLTIFLAIHRFLSVALPHQVRSLKTKHAVFICLMIALLSPLLHIYQLFDDKMQFGVCTWFLHLGACKGDCIQMLMLLIIMHLIPCSVLLSFTIMFIRSLRGREDAVRDTNVSNSQLKRRVVENRRMTIIVVAIVIVFLISEIPNAFILLSTVIEVINPDIVTMDLETRTAMLMVYNILLILSFHANIYIYTLFNSKFRTLLFKTFVQPVRRCIGHIRRVPIITTCRNNEQLEHMRMESYQMTNTNAVSVEIMNAASVGITETTHEDNDIVGDNVCD